ncbi:MAG: DnaJ domain-containing protein [Rhizobiaceae bacterium]|nr:DnaJ domain-containing protein [Rhizobiaceae bacterium]
MSIVLAVFVGLAVLLGLLYALAKADAARLAQSLRLVGPLLLGAAGAVMIVLGRAGLGGMLLTAAIGLYTATARRRAAVKTPGGKSSVRTAALEMELDHDSGGLEGLVLAGRHEGKMLSAMGLPELLQLMQDVSGDSESRQLLETYLDGRFPVWRKHTDTDGGGRQGRAPGTGAMTKEEAYKVLGLEPGAAPADVRKAHRRLMQRLHPDLGGTSFLAARINEAKDVLLSDHNSNS